MDDILGVRSSVCDVFVVKLVDFNAVSQWFCAPFRSKKVFDMEKWHATNDRRQDGGSERHVVIEQNYSEQDVIEFKDITAQL